MQNLCLTGAEIISKVKDFFWLAFSEFVSLWYWPIIIIGLMLVVSIVLFSLIGASYERRILKSVNKINNYFLSKPFITEENLVEFNLKMKKVPKVLRNAWQVYMLNREDAPTTYINVQTCIDKPLRTSSIEKHMSIYTILSIFIAFVGFVAGLAYSRVSLITDTGEVIFYALLVPLGVLFLYVASIWIANYRKNDIYSLLYDNFPIYERNLTKAVSTLPSYVDYEILFTKKEIKEGIPILQQYLEKRALIEQQELEKARENAVASEEYNFDDLGIDGSLVLERAMKECEIFIKTRRRLQEECDQIETEKENYRKNFEISEKDYQRKLQASRENLESLKAQQEASTNRIESNYIKKQQSDEIKKQQQLEKDSEEATAKFNEEQVTLEQEIEKRKQEIEEKKLFVQQAMILEFKHYANTLYKALSQKAAEVGNQKLLVMAQENADLKAFVSDLQGVEADVNVQDNLIQQNEVANDNLYEMTNSDANMLNDSREQSKVNEEAENEKEEEKKKAEQAKQSEEGQNIETAPSAENINNAVATEDQNAESTSSSMPNADSNDDSNAISSGESNNNATDTTDNDTNDTTDNNITDTTSDADVSGSDTANDVNVDNSNGTDDVDGGKEMQSSEPQVESTNPKESEDDLQTIQKQIEEANANLQKQKQEFENDVNTTISKMESQNEPNVVEDKPQEEPAPQVETPKVVQESTIEEKEVEAPAPKAQDVEEDVEEEVSPVRASRSVRRPAGRSVRAQSRTSRSASTRAKANSEIDALNAEMEKLLDSTKR